MQPPLFAEGVLLVERRSLGMAVLLALLAVALPLVLSSCAGGDDGPTELQLSGPSDFRGVRQLPPIALPDVTLIDTDGKRYPLRERAAGKVTLLYLGYTHCPDVCPTHMAQIAHALREVSPETAAQVLVVFITTDPERDTSAVLRDWLDRFDSSFVGLTGTQKQLDGVQTSLNANPASKTDLGGGHYSVDHLAYVIAFTPERQDARLVYPADMSWEDYAADLRTMIEKGKRP
ncbi:MAG: SCO family protein [Chloroflexi bacterium CFX7]|nr:SCO family protein [Chloroflexi bacterium CFX7]RIL03585.1 MAG: SCO family protein [bacterium]